MLPQKRDKRNLLLEIAADAVAAVRPESVLPTALERLPAGEGVHLLAIGKAANGMAGVAAKSLGDRLLDGIVVAPGPAKLPSRLRHFTGEHPVPGEGSLAAGEAVVAYLEDLEDEHPLLLLLSGGGSALVEAPAPGIGAADIRRVHEYCVGSGLPIEVINGVRARVSALKAGGIAALAGHREKIALVISDVVHAGAEFVSSGPFSPELAHAELPPDLPQDILDVLDRAGAVDRAAGQVEVIADNDMATSAAKHFAQKSNVDVVGTEALHGDAVAMARTLAKRIRDMPSGLLVGGGETTVRLPDQPGRGGRNQQLALALACELANEDGWCALAVGSDGIDGSSDDAGALVDGGTVARAALDGFDAGDALRHANAGLLLEAAGDLVHTGETGTNVADIFLALKW
ncbi:MAG: DUF4147 domain-containing protein [Gammaproteobacteria bacterium]|nr:DUF4147 domain-containing protein [Gammaproteobacteria bacterium]